MALHRWSYFGRKKGNFATTLSQVQASLRLSKNLFLSRTCYFDKISQHHLLKKVTSRRTMREALRCSLPT